jgi:hypothetical protein
VSNETVTYVVGGCLGVFGLVIFGVLVIAPAVHSYRRLYERLAALVLSLYVLAALIGIGIVLGGLVVIEWPRIF